jgi:hypothetical protein
MPAMFMAMLPVFEELNHQRLSRARQKHQKNQQNITNQAKEEGKQSSVSP